MQADVTGDVYQTRRRSGESEDGKTKDVAGTRLKAEDINPEPLKCAAQALMEEIVSHRYHFLLARARSTSKANERT